jgi:hypothetical protein
VAWQKLCLLVQTEPKLSSELMELIPDEMAAVATGADIPFIEKQIELFPDTRVWSDVVYLVRERLGLFED